MKPEFYIPSTYLLLCTFLWVPPKQFCKRNAVNSLKLQLFFPPNYIIIPLKWAQAVLLLLFYLLPIENQQRELGFGYNILYCLYKNKQKMVWSIIQTVTSNKNANNVSVMNINDNLSNHLPMANALNKYFLLLIIKS